ncbi:type I-D CRISPR-associated protein Cas5/Csc1 [Inediibacterium massiliense]|uniref:type I-D CRISPR-associated protein Cas5/Csc1 n=1 Tax=Inediibacterium massiliense TaxID=1658111 RepID=UPI0006B61790|nr:type I-D CRISPR-associated protein Cas5/Csc1 [Inediibacterium massiliense]
MKVYKYTLEFMEEVFFSSQEIDTLFMTKPLIGNYALIYAMGWCNARYNQTKVSYQEDFKKLNNEGIYITPAIINDPKYIIFTFNGLSDTYYHKMERALQNYPQMGRIKALSSGNKAEGLIFCKNDIKKISYIRLGKFMGKVKVTYEECSYKVIEDQKECYGLVNSVDLQEDFELISFRMINVHPVPLFKKLHGKGKMYQISTSEGVIYYPCSVVLGGIV